MAKFQVTLVQHREFSLTVEAAHERAALAIAEERFRESRPDEFMGDRPFDLEAIEAVALSDELAGGAAASSSAGRQAVSSPVAGGPLPEIARRFGLTATAIAAALLVLPLAPAKATIDGSASRLTYAGPDFTEFFNVSDPHETDLQGVLVIHYPLTVYLTADDPNDEIFVSSGQPAVYFSDGPCCAHSAPVDPPYFSLEAFLNAAGTEIDWSKGWELVIGFNQSPTDPDVFENVFVSENPGTSGEFSGPFDASYTYDASGDLLSEASVANNSSGVWTDPIIMVGAPEASTWAMLMTGFLGLGFAAIARRETGVLPNALRRRRAPAPARAAIRGRR